MTQEQILIEVRGAHVALARGPEGSGLRVVNERGRVLVPLSHDQAEGLARAAPGGVGVREIERRLLVRELPPDLDQYPHQRLRQGYIVVGQDASLRVREKGSGHKLTIKRGRGLDREEVEIEVSDLQAGLLWPLAGTRIIDKTRYDLPDEKADNGPGHLELDVYHGRLEGLALVEREFESAEAARNYTAPSWVGEDVTDDGRYTNARLAIEGLPKDAPRVR